MFSVDMVNTRVVYNFHIFHFLEFHDFMSDVLRAIDFARCLLNSAYFLTWSARCKCLGYLACESSLGNIFKVVVLFMSFPKC
jgi:hypothetical protein